MSKRQSGYLLPAGDAFTEDLCCALVFYPDKDEYRRALLGSLGYFSTWMAWETDQDKRGQDAARAWRLAEERTLECWEMACLDELIDDVAAIRLLLQQKACCDSTSITYSPTTITTTTILPGVGDDPTVYGETAVTDWSEWLEHLCYQAHKYVDELIHYGQTASNLFDAGGLTLDAWSSLLGLMNFVGLALPLFVGDLAVWLADFLLATTSTWFDNAASDLEDARDDIVCALMQGGNLGDEVETALGVTSEAWLSFYSLIDYDNAQAILYEGGAEDEFLPTEKRTDCDTCGYQQEDDTTVHVAKIWGESVNYNSETKEWTIPSWGVGGCEQSSFILWETPSKLARKPCKVVVTSCGGVTNCSSLKTSRGILDSSVVYDYDHPPLPHLDLSLVDEYRELHVAVVEYDLTFKLYTIP